MPPSSPQNDDYRDDARMRDYAFLPQLDDNTVMREPSASRRRSGTPRLVTNDAARARSARRSPEMQARIAQRVAAATGVPQPEQPEPAPPTRMVNADYGQQQPPTPKKRIPSRQSYGSAQRILQQLEEQEASAAALSEQAAPAYGEPTRSAARNRAARDYDQAARDYNRAARAYDQAARDHNARRAGAYRDNANRDASYDTDYARDYDPRFAPANYDEDRIGHYGTDYGPEAWAGYESPQPANKIISVFDSIRTQLGKIHEALRGRSIKIPAVIAAALVFVALFAMSQSFRSNHPEQATPSSVAQPQSAATSTAPAASRSVYAAPEPAKLVPKGAPLHARGRDYELESLIELQKRRSASINLKKRDTWFQRGNTTDWSFEPNGRKVVYLTFDDGPSPLTPQVLEVLDRYGAKATFFVVGVDPNYFDYIKIAYDAGHTIALHTGSHDYAYLYSSEGAFFDDLNTIGHIVEQQIGYVPAFTRFPGGTSNTISANYCAGIMSVLVNSVPAAGYQYYDWNSGTYDAMSGTTPTDVIISEACSYSEDNLIMLAHDSETKTTTLEALPTIIEHYLRLGYSFEAITPDSMVYQHEPMN